MPRGLSDYGLYQEQYAIAGMADLGEAVARLDSINVFDRRGFTIWQDDFEAPVLRWRGTSGGVGQIPRLDVTRSVSGIQCVFLNVPAGLNAISTLDRRFPLIRRGRIGVEFWVQGLTTTVGGFVMNLASYDGITPYTATIYYNTTTQIIYIVTPLGNIPIVTNVYMVNDRRYFLPIKLVIDMDTDMYVRLLVGETEYDISAHQQVITGASANKYVDVAFSIVSNNIDDMWMYIDNFILTQNEP